ncbi:MAG: hypothetical protein Kow00114_22630 [Kiloniellaceae bacterium]
MTSTVSRFSAVSRRQALIGAALLAAAAFAGFGSGARAHDFTLGALKIDHPWARASAGPARNSAAFMTIHNAGDADRLLAAAADVSERVELHTHMMEGNVMKMRQVEAIEVPANGTAELQPGGFHVMLIGLKAPLKEGESFPLTLTFEKAGTITLDIAVEAITSMGQGTMNGGTMGGMGHGTMNHGTMGGSQQPSN